MYLFEFKLLVSEIHNIYNELFDSWESNLKGVKIFKGNNQI